MSSTPTGPTPKPNRRRATAPESEPTPDPARPRRRRARVRADADAPRPERPSPSADAVPEPRAEDTTELPVDPSPAPTGDLTGDERAELERLRAQVAATQALSQGVAPPAAARPSRTGRGRWAGAIVLLLVAALLAPLSALANWSRVDAARRGRGTWPSWHRWRRTRRCRRRCRAGSPTRCSSSSRSRSSRPRPSTPSPPGPGSRASPRTCRSSCRPSPSRSRTRSTASPQDQVSKLVASDTFQDAWVAANREAHAGVVAALTGETEQRRGRGHRTARSPSTSGPFIEQIKPVLVERGRPLRRQDPGGQRPVRRAPEREPGQGPERGPAARPAARGAARARDPGAHRRGGAGPGPAARPGHRGVDDRRHARAAPARRAGAAGPVPRRPREGAARAAGGHGGLRRRHDAPAGLGPLVGDALPPHRARGLGRRPVERRRRRAVGADPAVRDDEHADRRPGLAWRASSARNTVALRAAVGGLAVLALLVGDRPSAGGVLLIAVLAARRPDRRRGAASLGRRGSGRCGTRHPRMPCRRRERPPSPGGGRRGGRPRAAGPRS